jgi:hypothetical protein
VEHSLLSKQFHIVPLDAVQSGSSHLVDEVADFGQIFCMMSSKNWYRSAATSHTIIDQYQTKLDSLQPNGPSTVCRS